MVMTIELVAGCVAGCVGDVESTDRPREIERSAYNRVQRLSSAEVHTNALLHSHTESGLREQYIVPLGNTLSR